MRTSPARVLLLLLCCATLLLPAAALAKGQPQEPMGNLVLILTTDDEAKADAAIRIASVAAHRGHKVFMLLRIEAIQLALNDTDHEIGGVRIQDKLAKFMKGGSQVFVGGGCMKLQKISPQRLIPGVRVGTPDSVMGMIFAKNTRIICQ